MYQPPTRAAFRAQLAARLQDPSNVFWSVTELNSHIDEGLQLLGVAALYFRQRVSQELAQGVTFYDTADFQVNFTFPLSRNTTDQQLVNQIQRYFQEPVNDFSVSSTWAGTEMFTMDDLQQALQRRLYQYLFDTRCVVVERELTVTAGNGRVELPDETIDIVRLTWSRVDSGGNPTSTRRLLRIDEATAARQAPRWTTTPGRPSHFSLVVEPDKHIQLVPAPSDSGILKLYLVTAGSTLDVALGTEIDLPNDLAQFVRWGAMADLLGRDGQSRDPQRSSYCEQRYKEGVQLGRIYTALMNAELNGRPMQMTSMETLDAQTPRWQDAQGVTKMIATAGVNLLAVSAPPDTTYSVTMDVVRNAILPTADGELVQVSAEVNSALLDYCEHLALFKCGGAEFDATLPHYQRFMSLCADLNSRLKANAKMFETLTGTSQQQEKAQPARAA